MIGWADNWDYANFAPSDTAGFRGKMTLARKMRLIRTAKGLRLAFSFEGLDGLRSRCCPLMPGENRLRSQSFGLKVTVKGPGSILLKNQQGELLAIRVTDSEILADRTGAGQDQFSEIYASPAYGRTHAPRISMDASREASAKAPEMEIILDKCILEILADDGLIPITASVYPANPYEKICLYGDLEVSYYTLE